MTMTERVMGLIGLETMTHREALLEELSELTSEQLFKVLFSNMGEGDKLLRIIGDYQCADCRSLRGGTCPAEESGEDCETHGLSTEAWLDLPCKRERLVDWEAVFK